MAGATSPVRRSTRQRAAVVEALGRTEEFVSAQQLHAAMRGAGDSVGLATVYRTLQLLADSGEVDVRRTEDGEATYRTCRTAEHHHHLVCRRCGRTVEVTSTVVERWATSVATEHGFTDVDHTVEVTGTCAACAGPRGV